MQDTWGIGLNGLHKVYFLALLDNNSSIFESSSVLFLNFKILLNYGNDKQSTTRNRKANDTGTKTHGTRSKGLAGEISTRSPRKI